MEKDINLYTVETKQCGTFFVIAKSFGEAGEIVKNELDNSDYGSYSAREVVSIKQLANRHFFNNKQFFSGDNNKLVIQTELLDILYKTPSNY